MNTSKKLMAMAVLSCSLAACGGGGTTAAATPSSAGIAFAGRTAGDGGGGFNTYTTQAGISGDAQLTSVNQNDFVRLLLYTVLESDYIGYAFRSDGTDEPDNQIKVNAVRDQIVLLAEEAAASKRYQARPYNQTFGCESGDYTLAGELDNSTLAGVLSITFNDCAVGGVTKRGNATITINKISSNLLVDYSIGYDGLTVATSNELLLYTGSQHGVRTLTNGLLTKYVVTSDLYRQNQTNFDRTSLDQTENTSTVSGQQITGKLCDTDYGCVNLSTRIAFNANGGEATMSGANKSKILVFLAQGQLRSTLDEGNGSYQSPVVFVN